MEKVKLTRKQADVIETMKAKGASLSEIVERHVHKDPLLVNDSDSLLALPTDTLIRALYIGYEIEETPEDNLLDYFNRVCSNRDQSSPEYARKWGGEKSGIINTLEILGIKIKGVNDRD